MSVQGWWALRVDRQDSHVINIKESVRTQVTCLHRVGGHSGYVGIQSRKHQGVGRCMT